MWSPDITELGSLNENVNFSHSITYTDDLGGVYSVTITANEINPPSISVSGNTISGYYKDSFENSLVYRTKDGQFITVKHFEEIDTTALHEMVSYKASTQRYKVYNYTAKAYNGTTLAATQNYTKTVVNDWTQGKNSLQSYVRLTNASS